MPRDLILQARRAHWSRQRPAPELVGYAWAVLEISEGRPPSVRALAAWTGWGRTKSARILRRADYAGRATTEPPTPSDIKGLGLTACHDRATSPIGRAITEPPTPNNSEGLRGAACHDRADGANSRSASRARDPSLEKISVLKNTNKKTTEADRARDTWDRCVEFRKKIEPTYRTSWGAKTRRLIVGRSRQFGADDVFAVWCWALTSPHQRAQFLREKGLIRAATLFDVEKFPNYLNFANAEIAASAAKREQTFDEFIGGI